MGPTRRLVTIKRSGVDGPHFPLSLSTCLFGRSIECDIRIQLPVVSKQHCKIEISEQGAVLFNFSSTNPTQINGSTFDKPVQLKHGDVITIVDRSFRYENESHQDASKSPGFPGQRRDQETSRRVSRSSLSSNPEGKAQDSSACSEVTEEAVSGRPVAHREDVTAAHAVSGHWEDHVARRTPSHVPSSELPGDNRRGATDPTAGDLKEDPSVASGACREEPKALSSIQCLKRCDQSQSPFRKLYESMKVELDVNPGKGNVLQNRRKSGLQRHCTTGRESADGLQIETLVSPKFRRKSGRSPHMKADPGLGEQESSQTEGEGSGEPVQTPKEPRSPGIARMETETRKTRTPVRCSLQTTTPLRCSPHSPSRRRRSEDPSVIGGRVSQSLDQSEVSGADDKTLTPQKFLPRNQTPVKVGSFGNTPEKLFSRKRKSMPANVDHLTAETEIPHPTISAPLALQVERKIQSDFLNKPEKLGPAAGQVGPGLSSLGSADVCGFGDSTNKMEGVAAKRRRVSFGGRLRPELFDENLPPNTPIKKGETPKQRRSLAAHTPTVLKKIIKEQPQPSGKEDSSEVRLKVTSPDTLMSSPAPHAVHASAAAPDQCRRLSKVSCVSGVGGSPRQTDVPKRRGRRSSGLPAQKASLERSQHGILQTIFSRRRSGASEANLIVARSWADVVKLGAKQAQHKAAKHGPPRQPGRRQRRANTPKKLPSTVHSQFSTGHANSPCTIVIGKAQLEKVTGPARPYRVINNFVVSKPRDFSEDLSGLPEMFKTPVKEKPQRMSMCPPTFPDSEDLLGKELPGPHSGEKPLLCTLENFGEDVFPRTQDAAKGPSDQSSASPALRRPSIKMSEDTVKTPRSMNKTTAAEKKTPVSTAATPKATSSANRSRRSAELSGVQTPGTGPENQDAKPDPMEDILGRSLGKTPQPEPKLERDTKESEKSFKKCKQNIESKENSEKTIAVRRSRRASELKCEPAADLTTGGQVRRSGGRPPLQRFQDTEAEENQVDILSLLQTPGHAKEVTDAENRATKMSCKSPKPGAVRTPTRVSTQLKTPSQKVDVGGSSDLRKPSETPGKATPTQREPRDAKSIQLFKETPKQKLDPAENSAGSKRRPRTPKGKAPPLEDLTGFSELFQTPHQAKEPMTDDKTTKTPCKSPQPEPVNTPSRRGHLRTPSQKVNVQEGLSALRKPQQTPGKAIQSPREPEGGDRGIAVSQEAPEEKPDLAGKVPSAKRRPRTPKGKAQPLEDLTGFKELFQTPDQAKEPMTDDKTTKTPYKSPAETINTPASKKRRLKSPPRKVGIEKELSVLRRPAQTPGGTRHSEGEAAGDGEDIKAFTGTPRQKSDPAENVTGIKRQLRTPKEKVQSLEDLTGFRELFQTPDHTKDPRAVLKTPKMLCQSPPLEPVNITPGRRGSLRTPSQKVDMQEDRSALRKPTQTSGMTTHLPKEPKGGDRSPAVSQETPEEKPDPAENLIASKRQPRTPQKKAQLLEDLDGFKELFQTPDRANGPMTDDKPTTMPCKSPPVEPVNTPSKKRQLKSPPQKVDVKEELSALRGPAHTPGGARHSEGEAAGDSEDKALKKAPKQKLDSAENLTGSKRRPRASLKEKAQPLEDLTGFKELFQTPHQSKGPMTDNSIPKMICRSPQPEPVTLTPGRRGHLGTPSQMLDRQEDCSALRKPQQTPGEATYSHREPEGGDRGTAVSQEAPEEKPDSAGHVTARKRQPGTPREKAQPLEDLSGFEELFQTPDHAKQPIMIDDQPPTIPCKSPAESVTRRTGRKKQLRSSPEEVGVEEPSALRRPSQTPGEATCMQREAVKDEKDTKVCKKTSRQKLVSAENVTGVKSRLRNVKEKAQPTEDPARVKEPFQKPNQTEEPGNDVKIAPASHQSPPAKPITRRTTRQRRLRSPPGTVAVEEPSASIGPTQTPGDTHTEPVGKGKDIKVLKETSGQKLSPAENVTGIRIRLRTLKKKTQPLEDSASVKELFQKPDQAKEAESDVTIAPGPRPSPPAEPVTRPTSRKRQPKSSPEKVDKEEPTPTPGESTRGQPARDEKDSRVRKEDPRQKLNPAENVTGVRSRLRTLREKTQPLEDLASVKELFQDPDQAKEPEGDVTTIPMPRQSPPAKPVTRPTSRKRQLKLSPEKVDVERPSARIEPTRTPWETTHSEPVHDEKDNRVLKEDSKQKLNPAENVIGVRSRLRTLKEKAQPLEDPAGVKELFQRRDGAKEPVSDVTMAPAPRQSPPAQPVTRRTGRQRQLRSPPGKAAVDEPSALSRPAQTPGEATHTEPVGDENKIKTAKETLRRSPDLAENVTGVRSRRKAFKEKTVEDPARFQEPFQKPDQAEELESNATAIKRAPKQTAERRPVETSRRVLRARKVRFTEDLVGSREPAKLPGESCISLSPERDQGEDGRVTGRKRLRPVTAAQDPEDERPLQKKQRTVPRETREPPSPSGVKKRSLRTLAQRTEPVGNLPDDDLKTKATDPQGEVAQAPNKGVSLRSRRPAKTSVEEQRPEVLISAEKVKIKRSEKKSVQTSQGMKLQSPEDGAEKPASGGRVEERRTRSRPGRLKTPLPEAAEEKAGEGRVDVPVKKQEEKEGTGHSDPKGPRSRKVSVRPPGNPLESASEQRATRSAKRCAHSLQKESDNVCVKKIRTRSRRDPEDI
ncbi:proliferation marker protein Ki-67 isoform X3 [Cervus elaphus]|uniref:proliferation marker protein Ki-67 isoform X3 n=1 Tax=Cervus elaphus TaxID=9860 RepID=UPI001CC2D424|nr:proliferation marker protein Ki-67 isoform X3 [Cervus elaphus]